MLLYSAQTLSVADEVGLSVHAASNIGSIDPVRQKWKAPDPIFDMPVDFVSHLV